MIKYSWLNFKNVFFVLFAFSFLPSLFKTFNHYYKNIVDPHTKVGCLTITTLADSTFYLKEITAFLKNDSIKGLLLKIKSPGGLPGTSQTLFNELKKFQEKKPIVAFIEDIGASGGYYVALAAHTIIANPSALVGSIGARMMKANVEKFLRSHNIEVDEISSGKYKTATSFLKEKSPREIAYLQELSDDIYDQFVLDVAHCRNLPLNHSEIWADGKIFTGNQALALQLIDKVGSINEAKEELSNLIVEKGIKVQGELKLVYPKQLKGLARFLYGAQQENEVDSSSASIAATFLSSVYDKVVHLQESKHPISL